MSKIIFVSYAAGTYKRNIYWNKFFVKLFVRPEIILFLTDDDLRQDPIHQKYQSVFSAKTGAGFWAWKPWVILKAMEFAEDDDIVLYQDCGQGLRYKNLMRPNSIINYANIHGVMPGVLVPEHGTNKEWTHHQCFDLMECDAEIFFISPQVEAVISAWKVNSETKQLVQDWLNFCTNEKIISDSYIEYDSVFATKGHRYDQSILTNLVIKYGLVPVSHDVSGAHLFKSMTFLNLFLAKDKWYTNIIFSIACLCVKLLRAIRSNNIPTTPAEKN